VPNPFKKIPVVYYHQPYTEWHDVERLIERLEIKMSNHADTNDYFDSPIIVAKGTIESFAKKGEAGKIIQAMEGADINYLTWDQAPESTRMEIQNLEKYIYSLTHTPDVSFEQMKGLSQFSGIALKMLFLDAHLKAADKEEIFGIGVQRRYNLLKTIIVSLDPSMKAGTSLEVKPCFEYFLPTNQSEMVDMLVKATAGGFMSNETAIEENPLVEDSDQEKKRIKTEEDAAQQKMLATAAATAAPAPNANPLSAA
jgi:SPP1 family phage portal protein